MGCDPAPRRRRRRRCPRRARRWGWTRRRRGGHAKWGRRQQQMYERGPTPTVETTWVQCERCEKWRSLGVGVPEPDVEEWFCEMNGDPNYNNCDAPEQPFEDDEAAAPTARAPISRETATATATRRRRHGRPPRRVADDGQSAGSDGDAPVASGVWRPRRRRMRRRRCSPRSAAAPKAGAAAMRDSSSSPSSPGSAGGAGVKRQAECRPALASEAAASDDEEEE